MMPMMPSPDGGPVYMDPPPGTPVARLMGFPLDVDLGTVNTGVSRALGVTITNIGDAQSAPLQATLMSGADLKLTSNCVNVRLRSGETCVVTATFEPKSVGPQMATGSVTDGSGTSFGTIAFMARGVGRLAPDAGPDVAPPPRMDAGGDVGGGPPDAAPPRDTSPPPPDVARDVAPEAAPKLDSAVTPDMATGG